MHHTSVPGLLVASSRATRFTCDSGTPVTRSTSFGFHFVPDVAHAVDAATDVFLVLPAVLEDVVEDPPDQRDVAARAHPDIFVGMRRGAGETRVADDQRRAVL